MRKQRTGNMSFSLVWIPTPVSAFCGWTDEQRGFQGRPGGWTSPQPQAERLLVGKGGAHFLGSDPPSGPFLLLFFAFLLLFCFCLLFCCFFCFFPQFFAIFDTEVSQIEGPQFGSGTSPVGAPPPHLYLLPLPSPFPSLPLPSPSFPSLPLSSPPFSSPSPQSLSIPFLLLSLPSLPSSYPSPSPSPRPQVSRLRALVFLTSNPLAQELCYAHVLSKRRGPWSEPDLSLPDQLHASSMQRMSCHSHNVTAQCTEVPLLWVGMTCCKFHLLSDILLNSCWYCSFPFRISCFPSLLCRLYYPVQADLLFRFVLHVPCSLFPGRISRNVFPQVMCVFFQLALVLSNCSAFVTCASFRLSSFATMFSLRLTLFNAFVLQLLFSPFWNLHFSIPFFCNCHVCLSQTCMFHSHFFCNCHFCLSQTCIFHLHFFCICHFCLSLSCIFQSHFFCIVSAFFQVEHILEQAQFDSTILVA